MNKILKYSILTIVLTLFAGFVASCDDDDDLSPDRLFRPQVKETFVSGTYITLKWDRYEGTQSYDIALSTDTFKTVLRKVTTDSIEYTFRDLEYDTDYQVVLRGVGNGLVSKEIGYYLKTDDYPTLLQSIGDADIIDTQVRVSWEDVNYDLFEIHLGKKGELVESIELDAEDNKEKQMIISKLSPATSYSVYAYNVEGDQKVYKGKKLFKTAAAQVYDGEVIDLRELSDEESLDLLTPAYIAEINTNYPSGATIVLKGGAVYNISNAIELKANTTFITGLSFKGNASFAIDNNFVVPDATTVGKAKFEKIFFTEGAKNKKGAGNFGGTYVFNFNKAGAKLDSLVFENCMIKYKRGVIRSQTEATINNVTINNCVIDSIGGYGIVNNDNDKSTILNIKITNSTISHVEKFLVGVKGSVNSILLEDVTMCYVPKGSSYFFDYNKQAIPGGLTVKNCLFGTGWGSSVNGMRSSASSILFNNSYKTSDLEWVIDEKTKEPTAPIDALSDAGKKSTEVFKDPEKGDFTLINSDIKDKKVGDPRWR